MNVSLTPELEQFIGRKVESGMYQTASEVVREGLRLLKKRDEDRPAGGSKNSARRSPSGWKSAERGQVKPFNEETARADQGRGRERLAAERRGRVEMTEAQIYRPSRGRPPTTLWAYLAGSTRRGGRPTR